MRTASLGLALMVLGNLIHVADSRADFVLTDKNDANGVTIPTGYTASSTYIMETDTTDNNIRSVQTAGPIAGFRFTDTDSTPATLLTSPYASPDLRQGTNVLPSPPQNLAGNENNGYVGTVVGKTWGNAVTLSFNGFLLTNGPGADLYVTAKDVNGSGVVQSTSSGDKSFAIGFHILNGPLPGWHLYNATALPTNFQPPEGAGNVLGAIDLSSLKLASAAGIYNDGAPLAGITSFIPAGALIDHVILVNNNAANAHSWGFLGNTSEAPTGFVAARDFDNADLDGNAFTGVDYLTGRYGTRYFNGQDAPQAWFVGLSNITAAAVPEPSAFLFGGVICLVSGIVYVGQKLRRRRTTT